MPTYKLLAPPAWPEMGILADLITKADTLHATGREGVAVVAEAVVYQPRTPTATDLPAVLRRVGRWNDGTVCVAWSTTSEREDTVAVTLTRPPLAGVVVYAATWKAAGWEVSRHRPGRWESHLRHVAAHATACSAGMALSDPGDADAATLPVDDADLFPELG